VNRFTGTGGEGAAALPANEIEQAAEDFMRKESFFIFCPLKFINNGKGCHPSLFPDLLA